MNTVLTILLCSALFVVLGVLKRDRGGQARSDDEPDAVECGACDLPCETSESSHARP